MPQLQPADFAPQLIWLAIAFSLLYFGVTRLAIPRIEHVITERKSRIAADLVKARGARRLAEEESARYDAEIASARTKAQAALGAERQKLESELSKKRAATEEETAAITAKAEERVQTLRNSASASMGTIASDVVNEIVKELAGVEVSADEVRAALRYALKE